MAGWTVHDPHAGILSYQYAFNEQGGNATTFAARIPDGGLVVISPGANMADADFAELADWGEVRVVVANNGFHHLGLPEWRRRFRAANFYAPKRAAARIAKKNPLAPKLQNLADIGEQLGGQVYLREAPQSKTGELWAWVKTPAGNYWFGSDIFCNWETFPGNFLLNTAWKLTNSGPGFSLFNLAMMAILKDKKMALKTMLSDMEDNPPKTLVISHGPPLDHPTVATDAMKLLRGAL